MVREPGSWLTSLELQRALYKSVRNFSAILLLRSCSSQFENLQVIRDRKTNEKITEGTKIAGANEEDIFKILNVTMR